MQRKKLEKKELRKSEGCTYALFLLQRTLRNVWHQGSATSQDPRMRKLVVLIPEMELKGGVPDKRSQSKMTLTWSDKGFEGELPVIKDQAQMWEPSGHHHQPLDPACCSPSLGTPGASCSRCSLCTSQSSWCLSHGDLGPLGT